MLQFVKQTIDSIIENELLSPLEIDKAKQHYEKYDHVVLSQGKEKITLLVENENDSHVVQIILNDGEHLLAKIDNSFSEWNACGLTSLFVIENEFKEKTLSEGIKYTREGMRKRVLEERLDRAKKADYKVTLANNLYGEHLLTNEKGKTYKITLRDFKNKTGYINNIDWKTNKLGTTKHIMYLFNYVEEHKNTVDKLSKHYPFIEIYTDPLNDYKISWFFPDDLENEEKKLIHTYFGTKNYIEHSKTASFFSFIHKSKDFQRIKIREEVLEKIEDYFEAHELEQIKSNTVLDFSLINATLYPYQKEGVEFSVFKKGIIIADEMGLGKTLQAIATAIFKKNNFNFKKTLVICPASVKHQWKNEIKKFTNESVIVIEGAPKERNKLYLNDSSFFHIINYETVLRDLPTINKVNYDFVVLDEAQKIKNYETQTSNAIKAIHKNHALVITGTPLENKLLDLYSIVQFLDQKFLTPQWEFSYQYCIFDSKYKNKINGYYNLQHLKKRLAPILIRREKQQVFEQLPNVIQKDIFTTLSDEQMSFHSSFARGIAVILRKKFKTTFDWQKLMHLLTNMRMVCDSTYLIDKETHHSPKLVELRHILIDKLDLLNTKRKVIIFSEWVTMLTIIGDLLKQEGITFTTLTGKVPVKKRGVLITEFENNPECSVFLSSESGGAGLNLQVADTIINFELPWNPAKKNQRIGRIDRIGQKNQKLLVYNLLSHSSIEMKIATGLLLKQDLFDGVLNTTNTIDEVDFSEKGKSQFIKQLEQVINEASFFEDHDDIEIETEEDSLLQNITTETQHLEIDSTETSTTNYNAEIAPNETQTPLEAITSSQNNEASPQVVSETSNTEKKATHFEEMETVMTKGMEFLTGIYKMSTGNAIDDAGKPKVKVNRETGEVSITFKMEV